MSVLESIRNSGLISSGERVLCALSGGPDSVCLTHALCALREDLVIEVAAAHFSHGLRPEYAEGERRLCQALCDSLQIPLFCGAGDTHAYAAEKHMGIEEAARTLRYNFLERTAEGWNATRIATAHTQSDQAETVLFHLIRGSGARGLSGIPAFRGRYIRPLLAVSRAEVEAYLAERGLSFAIDKSNGDQRYARNRLRLTALPLLEEIHPRAAKSIASAASLLASDNDCLEQMAASLTCGTHASVSALAQAHPAVAGRAVQALYRAAGGSANLYRRQIEGVLRLCTGACPSGQMALPGGIYAKRTYDILYLECADAKAPDVPAEAVLMPDVPVRFGPWEITLHDPAEAGFSFPKDVLTPPFTVRPRQAEDRILLNAGSHSLKKWMIDQKIPREQRALLPIVCDACRVLAVADLAKSNITGEGERISISCRRIIE
ncbi:MAG: tRNA lysidine(34) synthetase TilS [Clostridiaceae bacterium]|nr:tRNA lysidine(34) synthetase TilS [Clostridiaceae bacterium]